jgi:competence protein ComEC
MNEGLLGRLVDVRLLPAAATAWVAAWLATQWPGCAWWIAAGCAAIALAGVGIARGRGGARHFVAVAIALAAVGGALTAALTAIDVPARTPPEVAAALEGATVELDLVTTGPAREGARGHTYSATVTAVDGQSTPGAPVLLFAPPGVDAQPIGTGVRVVAKLVGAEAGDDVVALAFGRGELEVTGAPHPVLQLSNGVRERFVELAGDLPSPGAMLVPGLAVGDETLVDGELDAAMKASSLSHLTAVSGSNIAIIVAGFIGIGRLAGWPRLVRAAAASAGLAGFVLLVSPQGSVIRASAMALIVIALDAASRPIAGVPVLALAVIVLLAADPWLSHDYGFALSTAATAGLLLGTRPLADWLERWLPPPIALVIAVPLVAQVACQPILLLLEPSLPLYGVVANLLAAPAAPLATVVGLVACLIGLIVPPIGLALAWVSWLPAQWIGLIALTVTELPAAAVPWAGGALGAITWIAVCVAVVVLARRGAGRRWRRIRACTGAALAVVLVVLAAVGAGRVALRLRDLPDDWRLVACDIGQGDALLLRAAGGATMLIDTGDDPALLADCLADFGVERLDVLLVSHFDVDHVGAAESITVPVGEVWLPDTEAARGEPLTVRLQAAGVPVSFVGAGDAVAFGDLVVTALSPARGGDGAPSTLDGNDGSLVVRADPVADCRASCLSVLLLGDLGEQAQAGLDLDLVRVDVVKVSHHGSGDQLPELYQRAGARLALVSVGADNGYGHPTDRALEMLAAAGTPWLRTDESGSIAVFTVGGELGAWTSGGRG